MDYGDNLKRAWRITWNNKFLWILGFLAACGGNGGSGGGGNGGSFDSSGSGDFGDFEGQFDQVFPGLENFWDRFGLLVIGIICFLVLLRIVMWFVRLISEAGMIQAVTEIDNGQKSDFSAAFSAGRQHMGTLFLVNLILYGPIVLIALIAGAAAVIPLISSGGGEPDFSNFGFAFACFGILICLIIPISIILSLIYPLAQRGVVLRGLGALESIKDGWQVLKSNVGEVLILALIYAAIGFGIGIMSLIVIVPILIASFGPAFFALIENESLSAISSGSIALAGSGILCVAIVASAIQAVYVAYRSTSFTLAYDYFMGKMGLSKKVPI